MAFARSNIILILLCPMLSTAQLRNSNWIFSLGVGMYFNNGQTVNIPIAPFEGMPCAISDTAGQLLLSTENSAIYDSDQTSLPNSPDLWFGGFSTQFAQRELFIPKPGSPDRMLLIHNYVSFVERKCGFWEIDLNNGNPFVLDTAITWFFDGGVFDGQARRTCGIKHSNGTDYWLLLHGWHNNEFMAYNVNATGVDTVPTISSTGVNEDWVQDRGKIIASSNGELLAMVSEDVNMNIGDTTLLQLFSFNANNGNVQNICRIPEMVRVSGIEFSPNDQFLYVVEQDFVTPQYLQRIWQYDISILDSSLIVNSKTFVGVDTTLASYLGSDNTLALGIDGVIYVRHDGQQPHLGTILSPNSEGLSSNYQSQGYLTLGSGIGPLPSPIKRYHDSNPDTGVQEFEMLSFNLYPNPATHQLTIVGNGQRIPALRIHDATGRVVKNIPSQNVAPLVLNISNLSKGLYFIPITQDGRNTVLRFVKE